ncbi:unnamed protein product [Effrenium voratum]|uniref:Mitochondrial carrier protein n=1 Tax=Effrenium voratum TaxID=2562239 RepID=A0AA36ICE9_9DINO|nr:unnamed protein product [Effrenium voratum]CAJ1449392.1 unnamed protein product [Effrenium voratum]
MTAAMPVAGKDNSSGPSLPRKLSNSRSDQGGWSLLVKSCCGGVSGCMAKTAVAPLSRTVIQMQLHSTHHTGNMRSTLLSIYREGGILSFWRGNGAMLCHRGVVNCINFPVNDLCKQQLQQQDRELRNACSALAAALTGTAAGHPLDVIKTRLSASKRFGYVGIWQTAQRMYSEEGLRSFVAGFRVSLAAVGPSVAACFYLKDRFSASHVVHQLSTRSRGWLSESSIAGGAAGCVTSFAFFPLDSWKRQLQMSVVAAGGRARLAAVPLQGAALLDAYRGLLPELIKVGCNTAIMFGLYDWLNPRRL